MRIDTEVHVGQRFDKAIAVAVQVVGIELELIAEPDSEVRVGGGVEVVVVAAGVAGDTRVCVPREGRGGVMAAASSTASRP